MRKREPIAASNNSQADIAKETAKGPLAVAFGSEVAVVAEKSIADWQLRIREFKDSLGAWTGPLSELAFSHQQRNVLPNRRSRLAPPQCPTADG